ncbi:MAG: Ig-like domain-containing protein [Candidatus Heimdallarchaeota archaeon]
MKNKKRKLLSLIIVICSLLLFTGFTIAYTSYFDDFNGTSHGTSCHFSSSTQSSTGYLSIVSSSGNTVNPGENFILSVQVKSFSEADGKELKFGFPSGTPGRGDNKQFGFNTTMVSADITSGDSAIFDFLVNAPLTEQSYTLTADAIYRKSGSETIWASTNYIVTVQTSSDILPPELIIIDPKDNEYKNGNILINASVIDNGGSGVNTVWAEITNSNSFNQTVPMNLNTDPYYNAIWDSTSVLDGPYTITVKANDGAFNINNTESVNVIIDNTAPSIILNSVLPNPSNGLTSIRAMNFSSDINNYGIRATITTPTANKIFLDLIYQGGNEWNNTFTITQNGIYSVQINASDYLGNINISSSLSINGDILNPFVDITSPGNDGDTIGGDTIIISGWAYGTGTNIVSLFINDSRWGITQNKPQIDPSGTSSGPFSFENNSYISPGFYWVEVNITDAAGNINISKRYFEVVSNDIFPPILVFSLINPNPSNGFTNITVISNEPLIGNPLLSITTPNSTTIYRTLYPTGVPRTWITNYTIHETGTHFIQVNGTDLHSNVGFKTDSFYGDIDAPWITLDNVYPNPSNGLTLITAFNASSDIDINGLWATITTPSKSISIQLNYQENSKWNATFIVTEDGTYSIQVNATDFAGNTNITDLIYITGDISTPILSIISLPIESGVNAPNFSISITEPNLDGIWYSLYNGIYWSQNITIIGFNGTLEQSLWDTMPTGDILIRFYANDTLGHIGYIDITISKNIPQTNINPGEGTVSGFDLGIIIATTSAIPLIFIILWLKSRTKRFIR